MKGHPRNDMIAFWLSPMTNTIAASQLARSTGPFHPKPCPDLVTPAGRQPTAVSSEMDANDASLRSYSYVALGGEGRSRPGASNLRR